MLARHCFFAAVLLLSAAVHAGEYTSKASCIRAAETWEHCDKLFPEPPAPKIAPRPIAACTGMIEEATAQLRQAIIYIRFDSMDEASVRWRRAQSLNSDAYNCSLNAVGTNAEITAWKAAEADFSVQKDVMNAAMRAR